MPPQTPMGQMPPGQWQQPQTPPGQWQQNQQQQRTPTQGPVVR
jgi:hypothetical protein